METETVPSPHTPSMRLKQVLVVFCAIMVYGLVAGIRANTSLLSTEISSFTGIEYGNVSLAFSVMYVILACSIPALAILTLKIRYFYLFVTGIISAAIGFFGAAFAGNEVALIIFIGIFFGIGAAVLSFTLVFSAAKQFFSEKGSSILSGVLLASQGAFGMCLSGLIGVTNEAQGMTFCMNLLSICIICLLPFTLIFLKRKNQQESAAVEEKASQVTILATLKKMVTTPFFYLLLLGVASFAMGDGFLSNHLTQAVATTFNVDGIGLSVVASVYTISVMSGALIGGFMAAKLRNRSLTLAILFLLWVILSIVLRRLIVFYFSTGFETPIALLLIFFGSGFLMNACYVLIIALTLEHVSVLFSVVVIGIFDAISFLISSLNLTLGGFLYDICGDFSILYSIMYFLCLTTGIIYFIYSMRERKRKPKIYF